MGSVITIRNKAGKVEATIHYWPGSRRFEVYFPLGGEIEREPGEPLTKHLEAVFLYLSDSLKHGKEIKPCDIQLS